ncbi:MAG TPA: MmgE/PrpD family protein [Candidatus Entotheonella sp.]
MDRTTELLSAYACDLTYDDLPVEVVHQVKRTVIDTMGCALGGFHAEPSRIARHLAQTTSCAPPSRILGTACGSSPDMAGFANGVMVRYLDYNDSYFSPGGGHPSDVIAAVLALADPRGCDGRTVITAIVVAYEVFCRLSDQVVVSNLGWDQGMLSVIGSVCAAGKVMGLDREAMGHAISLASVSNVPLGAIRVGELSMWKGCATANATRAAIFSAQLAEQGMTGPEAPLDGRRGLWQQAVGQAVEIDPFDNAQTGFRIMSTIFKHYPSQIHTQGPIGLALDLRSQVDPSDIAAIHIRSYRAATSSAATEPEKWAPKTRETADHSIPYLVAYALQHGAITPHSFTAEGLQDPAVRALIGTMRIDEDTTFTERFCDEYNCQMEVTTRSGQRLSAAVTHPKGHWCNPLSDAEVESKFRALATEVMPGEQCDAALQQLWSLEQATTLQPMLDRLIVAEA